VKGREDIEKRGVTEPVKKADPLHRGRGKAELVF